MNFLIKLLLNGLAVIIASYILGGVTVDSFLTAIIVAALLALLNAVIKPLLIILTIPITIVTMGLFILVINAFIIMMADSLISGFSVDNFWWALLFSVILSIINAIFEDMSKK